MDATLNGVLNLDKPAGLSSARAVTRVKWLLPRGTKIGHAGTLDPFATGVLLILVGRGATKLCERLMGQPKRYSATIKLGATTATLDPTSPEMSFVPGDSTLCATGGLPARALLNAEDAGGQAARGTPEPGRPSPVTRAAIDAVIPSFVGDVLQQPPAFSALKVGGRPAYALAREGVAPPLQPRVVRIYSLTVTEYSWPFLSIDLRCGRGTYVRSVARDIGEKLGVGGYLQALRRTAVGDFDVADAVSLDLLHGIDDVRPRLRAIMSEGHVLRSGDASL